MEAYGVDFGDGLFGQEDVTTRFTIGDHIIATADDATKTMTVRRNGEVVKKTMPISMGKAKKTPTDNGAYIIGDRYSFLVMDSSTYGVPRQLARRLPHRSRMGHANVLQRHLRALCPPMVGG